ncbi:hypothetical protein WMF37_38770 [Sorangium sp. So ce291]|uniref:hypothetical protein n=1 Tax=Sorangium sp. So ce291 TaxID=3133294 RepID=UPI003F63A714
MPERPPEPPLTADEAAKHRARSYVERVISKRRCIDEVVAMGGMGALYRGEHVNMHKCVAIKILHPDTEPLPELVQRFSSFQLALVEHLPDPPLRCFDSDKWRTLMRGAIDLVNFGSSSSGGDSHPQSVRNVAAGAPHVGM